MAKKSKAKTYLKGGVRYDIRTNKPYTGGSFADLKSALSRLSNVQQTGGRVSYGGKTYDYSGNRVRISPGGSEELQYFSPAEAPANVVEINNVPEVKLPDLRPTFGSIDQASSAIKGMETLADYSLQEAGKAQEKQKEVQESQQSILKQILSLGKQKTADLRQETQEEYGIDPRQYFAERKAKIAELDTLTQQYNNLVAAKDTQIAQTQDRLGSMNFINNQVAQINRNAAPELNRLSSLINAKTAVMEMERGNFQDAMVFVNQAVEDAVADRKFQVDLLGTFYNYNKDLLSNLRSDYKDNFDRYYELLKLDYQTGLREAESKRDILLNAAKEGVDLSRYMDSKYSADEMARAASPLVASIKGEISETTIFDSIMRAAIDAGASPDLAALKAVEYAESKGIQLSKNERAALEKRANKIQRTPEPVTPISTKQPIYQRSKTTGGSVGRTLRYFPESLAETELKFGKTIGGAVGGFFAGLFGE